MKAERSQAVEDWLRTAYRWVGDRRGERYDHIVMRDLWQVAAVPSPADPTSVTSLPSPPPAVLSSRLIATLWNAVSVPFAERSPW